jgi:hypothetical protein
MAGILFTDRKLVLAGFNQHRFAITGIGGKKKDDELPWQTALRETLEELFEFVEIPERLLRIVAGSLSFDSLICSKGYSTFVMSFHDLNKIMRMLPFAGELVSRVYDVLPTTVEQLVLTRKVVQGAEFSHLSLIPFVHNLSLDRHFINDIYAFKNCENIIL